MLKSLCYLLALPLFLSAFIACDKGNGNHDADDCRNHNDSVFDVIIDHYRNGNSVKMLHMLDSLAPLMNDIDMDDDDEEELKTYQQYAHARMAYYAQFTSLTDSALFFGNEAKRIAVAMGDSKNAILSMSNLADIYRQRGDLTGAITEYDMGIRMNDSLKADSSLYLPMFSGMACTYNVMRNKRETERWLTRMASLGRYMTVIDSIALYQQTGNCLYFANDFEGSLAQFMRLDSLLKTHPEMEFDRIVCDVNLADNYVHLKRVDGVDGWLDRAVQFFNDNGITAYVPYVNTLRILHLMNKGDIAGAHDLALASMDEVERMNPDHKCTRYKVLADLRHKEGNGNEAMGYIHKYLQLNDSLRNSETKVWSNEVDSRYMRDHQLAENRQTLQENRIRMIGLWLAVTVLIILIIIVTIGITIYVRHIRRQRQADICNVIAARSELVRNRVTPHFISNALALGKNLSQEDIDDVIRIIRKSLAYPQQLTIRLDIELEMVENYLKVAKKLSRFNMVYSVDIADSVETDKVEIPAMGLLILAENAVKHGKANENGDIDIAVRIVRSREDIIVSLRNSGCMDFSLDRNNRVHHGLNMLSQTIALINRGKEWSMTFDMENTSDHHVESRFAVRRKP